MEHAVDVSASSLYEAVARGLRKLQANPWVGVIGEGLATITVEVRFPSGLRVTGVEQKPGWQAEAFRDSSGNLTGVRWIGNLPPEQFTEFGVLGVNPAKSGELVFTAIQAFADGTKIEWSGAAGSKTPAARVRVAR